MIDITITYLHYQRFWLLEKGSNSSSEYQNLVTIFFFQQQFIIFHDVCDAITLIKPCSEKYNKYLQNSLFSLSKRLNVFRCQ